MKLNKILLFSFITLPTCVLMRFFQILFTIEPKTGFFTEKSGNNGIVLLVLILLFTAGATFFAYLTHSKPENTPKGNIILNLASIFLAMSIIYETVFNVSYDSAIPWQTGLLFLSGLITAIYFAIFGIFGFVTSKKIPEIFSIVPIIYVIARMIYDFTAISKLAPISDNILLIATYSFVLLFMLNFAKLYNGVDKEKSFKKLLATGIASVILSFTTSLPNIIINLFFDIEYLHTSLEINFVLLFFGIYILSYLFSHFSKKNLDIE